MVAQVIFGYYDYFCYRHRLELENLRVRQLRELEILRQRARQSKSLGLLNDAKPATMGTSATSNSTTASSANINGIPHASTAITSDFRSLAVASNGVPASSSLPDTPSPIANSAEEGGIVLQFPPQMAKGQQQGAAGGTSTGAQQSTGTTMANSRAGSALSNQHQLPHSATTNGTGPMPMDPSLSVDESLLAAASGMPRPKTINDYLWHLADDLSKSSSLPSKAAAKAPTLNELRQKQVLDSMNSCSNGNGRNVSPAPFHQSQAPILAGSSSASSFASAGGQQGSQTGISSASAQHQTPASNLASPKAERKFSLPDGGAIHALVDNGITFQASSSQQRQHNIAGPSISQPPF